MTTANDRDRVAAIEARLGNELAGEHEVYVGRYGDHCFHVVTDDGRYKDIAATFEFSRSIEGDGERVEKIANAWAQAPADIAYLLARVRETEAALETCKRKLNLERGFVEYLTGASDENL